MTEKEQLSTQPKRLYRVAQLVQSGTLSYDDLSELIPGILHVNSASDLAIRYLSRDGLDIFRYSLEELQQLGHRALLKHQCNFTHTVTYPRLARELSNNDLHHTAQFFQDWQVKKDEKPLWFFSSAKSLSATEHICISITPNRIEEFIKRVDKTIEPNEIIEKYFHPFNALTKREKEILTLLGRDSS